MMWSNMQATQKILDERITQEMLLDPRSQGFRDNMVLALRVELAEYANETRCFKQWSRKDPAGEEIRLEEAVDALHFYLHLANEMNINLDNYRNELQEPSYRKETKRMTITWYINQAYDSLHSRNMTDHDLINSLYCFLIAARVDGFTFQIMEKAYYMKNKINHQRQTDGY